MPYSAREISAKVSVPSPLKSSETTQLTSFCGMPAEASSRSVPSTIATDSRYLMPWSSQVTIGQSGLSPGTVLPFLGLTPTAWTGVEQE